MSGSIPAIPAQAAGQARGGVHGVSGARGNLQGAATHDIAITKHSETDRQTDYAPQKEENQNAVIKTQILIKQLQSIGRGRKTCR